MIAGKKYEAIVIGTSAGGLVALSALLSPLPATLRIPIIVVQHRAKDQRELLEEVLQAKCSVKIRQADEKEKIGRDTVYIAPPNYHLMIERDHTFSLTVDDPVSNARPSVDVLFESAALAYGNKLIAIILTGANSDGARGMLAVKEAGGLTIVQSPTEAQFPGMPRAAIENGSAAHILKLEEIKNLILNLTL